jgi:hypothetical protein
VRYGESQPNLICSDFLHQRPLAEECPIVLNTYIHKTNCRYQYAACVCQILESSKINEDMAETRINIFRFSNKFRSTVLPVKTRHIILYTHGLQGTTKQNGSIISKEDIAGKPV